MRIRIITTGNFFLYGRSRHRMDCDIGLVHCHLDRRRCSCIGSKGRADRTLRTRCCKEKSFSTVLSTHKGHRPIPFPSHSVVCGHRLFPNWLLRIRGVPFKLRKDRLPFERLLRIEMTDPIFEKALHRINCRRFGISREDRPQPRCRIELPHCRSTLVDISKPIQNHPRLVREFEFFPIIASGKAGFERAIMNIPMPNEEIEIVIRRA